MNVVGQDIRPCPECGGERVEGDVTGNVTVTPRGKSSLFSGVTLEALVCTECGYTSLYVIEPLVFTSKRRHKGA